MGSGASEGLAMSHVLTWEIIYILYDSTLNCVYVLFQICITFYKKTSYYSYQSFSVLIHQIKLNQINSLSIS